MWFIPLQTQFLAARLGYSSVNASEWQQALHRPPEVSSFPQEASLAASLVLSAVF